MQVPSYNNNVPQADANTLPQNRLSAPTMVDTANQQAAQLGQSLTSSGGEMARIAGQMQDQANQLRVDDALNQAKEESLRLTYDKDVGYTNLKGINALERPDGKPLADEYSERLQNTIDRISGTLGNEVQRQAFAQGASGMVASLRGNAMQHEAQEFTTYGLSVAEGRQSTAQRDIALNYNNPDVIDGDIQVIQAETYRQAQLLGKSAKWQEAAARKMTSSAHKTALLAALEDNNPAYAEAYLRKYSSQMDADDILEVRGHITKEMDNQIGAAKADAVMATAQPVGETERAFNITLHTESAGQQFGADGKPLTSPKGAIGIAQVMPGTAPAAAKLAGRRGAKIVYLTY